MKSCRSQRNLEYCVFDRCCRPRKVKECFLSKRKLLVFLHIQHNGRSKPYHRMCFWCQVLLCLLSATPTLSQEPEHVLNDQFFLKRIFDKYGHDGVMTFEGFEHLLENLGLAQISFYDHDLLSHREEDNTFRNQHPHHEHSSDNKETEDNHSETDRVARDTFHQHSDQALGNSKNQSLRNTSNSHKNYTSLGFPHMKTAEVTFERCLTATEILHTFNIQQESNYLIRMKDFVDLCPAIIHQLDQKHCTGPVFNRHIHHEEPEDKTTDYRVWLFAFLGVVVISLCGLLSVGIVPIMQKVFYHTLIQFLVGLAIGSLTGDAMLHLLPHAMADHHHSEEVEEKGGEEYVWHGLTALGGVYMFLIVEKVLGIYTNRHRRRKSAKAAQSPKFIPSVDDEQSRVVGEKLSHHKHGSYGFSMDPAGMEALEKLNVVPVEEQEMPTLNEKYPCKDDYREEELHTHNDMQTPLQGEKTQDLVVIVKNGSKVASARCSSPDKSHHQPLCHNKREGSSLDECHTETLVYRQTIDDHSFTVTLADHHHHHNHGHSHQVPTSVSAVAWMVIMGDGLHNFSDGLAIGASFASSLSGGLSTTIAVFCHELPHELGDFAVLLKAGMSVKQALFYNILSSVLCLIGMVIGVALGNISTASSWIFAGAAGMFLYIALVDMLPELSASPSHSHSSTAHQLAVQLLGISLGVTTMFIIALYERDLQMLMS